MERFTIWLIVAKTGRQTSLIFRNNGIDFDYDISLLAADFMNSEQAKGIKGRKRKGVYYTDDPFEMLMTPDITESYYDDSKHALNAAEKFKRLLDRPFEKALAEYEELKNRYKLELTYKIRLRGAEPRSEWEDDIPVNKWADLKDSNHEVVYTCYSIADVIAALFHYYIITEYKLATCQHCGRVFATQTLKIKNCNRISPYKNHLSQKYDATKDKNCAQTVHDARQYIRTKKDSLSNLIRHSSLHQGVSNDNEQDTSVYYDFSEKCIEFDKRIKQEPTSKNLTEYNAFLKKTEEKKEWLLK